MNRKRCSVPVTLNGGKANHDCIVLVWLNLSNNQISTNVISLFRSLVSSFRIYTDTTSCYDDIRLIKEKIFLISSSIDNDLMSIAENIKNIENIFILDPNGQNVDGYYYPKLIGIYQSIDELLRELKITLHFYEQLQMENFLFENEKTFLWRQLWKKDVRYRS